MKRFFLNFILLLSVLTCVSGCSITPLNVTRLFPDPGLEQAVRFNLCKEDEQIITQSDLDKITYLHADHFVIANLSGIERLTNLTWLSLGSGYEGNKSHIKDLSLLKSLKKLDYLSVIWCDVSDLSPLVSLTNLTYLDLSSNKITDISPLSSLTQLTELNLSNNSIKDISPLLSLPSLSKLNLRWNRIESIPSASVNFSSFLLGGNQITDLSGLTITKMTPKPSGGILQELELFKNPIDLNLLPNLPDNGKIILDLRSNQISNIEPLVNLPPLRKLDLSDNDITDISPIVSIPKIYHLRLAHNNISDISPLVSINYIFGHLDLSSNEISDLSPLPKFPGAWRLNLENNQITDTSPLRRTFVWYLQLGWNKITDVSSLAHNQVKELYINDNLIQDVSSLAQAHFLEKLYVYRNPIQNLSAIKNKKDLLIYSSSSSSSTPPQEDTKRPTLIPVYIDPYQFPY